jgi:hypothetical protein
VEHLVGESRAMANQPEIQMGVTWEQQSPGVRVFLSNEPSSLTAASCSQDKREAQWVFTGTNLGTLTDCTSRLFQRRKRLGHNGLIVVEEAASQRHQSHREDRQDGDHTALLGPSKRKTT